MRGTIKVILSRKGFDSEYGGYPNPILPNEQMISLPIPDSKDGIRYSGIKAGESTCFDLKSFNPRIKSGNKRLDIDEDTRCHLDPDIYKKAISREPNWKPLFGQVRGT